jgi:glycosyltransferase involved in cell wall biosynthesis
MGQTPTPTTTATEAPGDPASAPGDGREVLIVFHEPIPGGATLSVLRTLPLLASRGWRFRFWVAEPSALAEHLRGLGFEVDGGERTVSYSLRALRLPPGPRERLRAMPRYLSALRRLARERRPALAHVNSLTTLAEGAVLRSAGVPVVAHIHEMIAPTAKGAAARAGVRAVSTEAIGVSGACAARLAIGGWHPHVVDEAAEYPAEPTARRRQPSEPAVVGSVGVISRRKGSDVFVEAAALVKEQRPETRFVLVGSPTDPLDADWAEGMLARAEQAGVEHRPSADVPERLAGLDVFALPSRIDPCPISLLEAMGAGVATVGAETDGIPEQLDGGEAGMLVPREDPAALAAAIVELVDDPGRAAELGRRGRARALDRYSLERQALGLERVWLEALTR